jgi:hypothetical protein
LRNTYLSSFAKLGFGLTLGCAAVAANASLTFFTSQGTFQTNLIGGGSTMVGFEDWEDSTIGANGIDAMDDPLNSSTSNAYYLPGQIDSHISIQSNMGGAVSTAMNPRGTQGLAMVNNFGGYPTDWVVANTFADALDVSFNGGIIGAGGKLNSALGSSTFRIDVYDTANVLQGSTNVVVSNTSGFWGVVSTSEIGRINLFASSVADAEGWDNVEMWAAPVPEPATMAALGLGAIALLRRRSKK